jgi:hypothetical protein
MKRRLLTLLTLVMLLTASFLLSMPALALDALAPDAGFGAAVVTPPAETSPFSFFSWEGLGTFSGAVALVVFLVQLLKLPLDKVWKIPTQYVVYILSVLVLLLAQAFVPSLGGFSAQRAMLCVFNGALVALSAMSAYEVTIRGPEREKLLAADETYAAAEVGDDSGDASA